MSREAKRTGPSKGAIVEALADEALRMRLFPKEIDAAIAENHRPIEQLEEEFPFIAVSRVED